MTVVSSLGAMACAAIWGFDDYSPEGQDAGDANIIDAPAGDAANDADVVDAGPCGANATFTKSDVLGITNRGWVSMRSATLSPNERTIYFHGKREAGETESLYVAKRNSRTEAFGEPELLKNVNAPPGPNISPSISVDGRTLVFSRSTTDAAYDLFVARRSGEDADFAGASPITPVNTPAFDQNPFLRPSVEELWFSSTRLDAGGPRIFRASAGGGSFVDAGYVPISDPKSTRQEAPVISADGKILFYSGNGDDPAGDANDIWEARANTAGGPFTARGRVVELSASGFLDYPSWLSPDGCRLYMQSAIGGAQGAKIYVGERKP